MSEEQGVVRIDPNLLPVIDTAIANTEDDFGAKKFRSRRQFVDEAVKVFLRSLKERKVEVRARS